MNNSLISIEDIQCITKHYEGCIQVSKNYNIYDTIFEPSNDFERSEEFLNRMIDRIYFVLSACKYNNVFIDIEVIKNDITKELKEETIEKYLQDKSDIQVFFKSYRKCQELLLNRIAIMLCKCFDFEGNSDYGILHLKRGGHKYDIYLDRGYFCLEKDGNVCIDTIKKVDNIKQFISLIKDLIEDDGCSKGLPFVRGEKEVKSVNCLEDTEK